MKISQNSAAHDQGTGSVEPGASGQQGKTPVSHAGGAGSVTREAHHLSPDQIAGFWARVRFGGSNFQCWEWEGRKNQAGYGRWAGTMAHRVAYELVHGPIPADQQVRHRCDNKPCCNPHHLLIGSQSDNMQDALERGQFATGERHGRARITDADALYIRRNPDRLKLADLAARFGLAKSTVSYIRSGRSWAHLAGDE